MLPGEAILGDDIAYFRAINGQARAANAEVGIFGIIQNVNPKDDPVIHDVLVKPGEVIFSNVLVKEGRPQPSFDKQFVRDYLEGLGWDKTPPAPALPPDIVQKTAEKYQEALRRLMS